ncbi:HNH endonuclease [Bdellovibrio sp. HCB2-146]|uniref:HNH endonuclease n=1 Tax=Bdellovibrio sp. HCB2-146 TaxID=3394362 RepID=UPI0039BC2775
MNSANIKAMTDNQLIERVEYLVRRERELVECLIWHLQEIQDRKLYIQMGFTSLFECLVKHFKYSEAVAYSRISALKIISAVPEAAEALNSGEVNLTTLSLTQSFIRKQEKETGEKVSPEQKVQYVESIKNKSTQEVKQILATISPVSELPLDKVQYLDQKHVQLQVTIDRTILEKIEKLKSLISHENIDPSYCDLLNIALDAAIEKVEKKKGIKISSKERRSLSKENNHSQNENLRKDVPIAIQIGAKTETQAQTSTQSFSVKSSRYILRDVKRFVLNRSNHQCEYIHSNGQRCTSKFQLQFDHIIAFSNGGTSALNNIQNLCRVHNANKGSR